MAIVRSKVSPLDFRTAIVDEYGCPTLQFLRLWQQMFGNEELTSDAAIVADTNATAALTGLDAKADKVTEIVAGTNLSGGGDLSTDRTIDHDSSGVTPGTYGDASNIPVIDVDAQGHVTDVSTVAVSGGGGGGGGLIPGAAFSGHYIWPATMTTATSNTTITANLIYFYPFITSCTLQSLATNVITPIALSNVRMALYTNGANNRPDTLIEECTMQATTSGGIKHAPFAANRAITDIVWIAVNHSHAIAIQRGTPSELAPMVLGLNSMNTAVNNSYSYVTAPFAFAAMPANTSALTLTNVTGGVALCGVGRQA